HDSPASADHTDWYDRVRPAGRRQRRILVATTEPLFWTISVQCGIEYQKMLFYLSRLCNHRYKSKQNCCAGHFRWFRPHEKSSPASSARQRSLRKDALPSRYECFMNDDQATPNPTKDRKFVEALSRGLDVLRAFSQGSVVLGNQDISRITGLPKPTVSRMTYTLTKLGYLAYSPQLEKYQLDSGVLALGYAYVSNLRVRQLAKPYLDEFARNTNTSVGLTCRDRLSMIYVENCRPAEITSLRMDVGVRLPLATTAAGRAYLAAMK